ncbi:MAG: heat-inducible transcription repressor HrcA [Clostridia bacterium]|nr:heat-inducible transcription repressor HrcA [Clostridia bacterium]
MELSERKKAILKSVIDSYIRTGDPVGSKSLTESKQFSLSSATIRSEMNDLEAMGYLEQPHTSAGRVPTPQGYRTYVDSLMEKYFLGMEELEVLDEVMSGKLVEVGRLMDEAAKAIGQITNYATFAFMGGSGSPVERYETVYVDEYSFLLIMIRGDGTIRNRHVKLMEPITPELLVSAKEALNTTMSGLSAEQINLSVILEFEEKMGEHRAFATTVLRVVHEMLGSYDSEKVHIDGVTKLLSYPEFMNVSKFQSILSLFEQRQRFAELMQHAVPGQTSVILGDEEKSEFAPPDTGFVFHPITVGGKVVGAIGVIGPQRMDYKKVVASLDYFAAGLTEQIELPDTAQSTRKDDDHAGK